MSLGTCGTTTKSLFLKFSPPNRIRLLFGSTARHYTRHYISTSLQLLIFNGETKYVIKKQLIKSENEYGFVGELQKKKYSNCTRSHS